MGEISQSSEEMNERDIFLRALEIADPDQQRSYLEETCASDPALRQRIELLLHCDSQNEGFLESDPQNLAMALLPEDSETQLREPEKTLGPFGKYTLLQVIAHGAMGVVYKARQSSPDRIVALKMIRGAMLASKDEIGRFLNESETTAQLEHPNIVPIYEIGECEGEHYFSMKYIEGGTLADHMPMLRKDPHAAVVLMQKIADAVDAAHRRGIIHRDLKPANVLMDEKGEPHISDFGLAKQLDSAERLTLSGQMMGTPYYMAPEQAQGGAKGLTTASDIYSLGAVFYEILSGQPPFKGDSVIDTLNLARDEPVPPIKSLHGREDRELQTIASKCLAKVPEERYSSAKALGDDLGCWLEGLPISARPVGGIERLIKWIKRKPVHAAFWGIAVLFITLLGVGGPIVALKQTRLKEEAETATALADEEARNNRDNLYAAEMRLALQAASGNEGSIQLKEITDRWIPKKGQEDLRDWEWYYLRSQLQGQAATRVKLHKSRVLEIAISSDGQKVATCGSDGMIRVMDATLEKELLAIGPLDKEVFSISWSQSDDRLIVGGNEGLLRLFCTESGEELKRFDLSSRFAVWSVAWAPVGDKIAAALPSQGILILNAKSGQELQRIDTAPSGQIHQVAWRPGSEELASASHFRGAAQWNLETEMEVVALRPTPRITNCVAWSPDGRKFAFGGRDQVVRIYEVESERILHELKGSLSEVRKLAWSPDGTVLASVGDTTIRLWDPEKGTLRRVLSGHLADTSALAWHPNGRVIISGDSSGMIHRWTQTAFKDSSILTVQKQLIFELAWNCDGTLLASANQDGWVRIWDPVLRKLRAKHQVHPDRGGAVAVDWTPDQKSLVSTDWKGNIRIWNAQTGQAEKQLKGHSGKHFALAVGPDGKRIYCTSQSKLHAWDLSQGQVHYELPIQGNARSTYLALSSRGTLLCSPFENKLMIWRAEDGALLHEIHAPHRIDNLAFNHDETKLAASSGDVVRIWTLKPGSSQVDEPMILKGHSRRVLDVDWSPDGSRLISAGRDATCRIWDPESGRQLLVLTGHEVQVHTVRWNPDGRSIATASYDGMIRIWDAALGYQEETAGPQRD